MVKMGRNKKIYLIIITAGLLAAGFAQAIVLTPPKLPVLFYGMARINNQLATTSPIITARRKTDGLEIASAAAGQTGKYFIEMPCADYIEQTMVFRIGNLITHEAICVDVATAPSVKLDLNFNSANQTVENTVSSIAIPAAISDSQAAEIHFAAISTAGSSTTVVIGSNGLTLIRQSSIPANNFLVTFASSTIISGDSSWDGTLIAPTLSNISLNIPADPDYVSQADKIINIGFTGQALTFDQPVSILFPGQSGRQIGFSRTSSDFTEITALCPINNASSLVAATAQECKFNGPADLTVWTKHFTYFAVYRQIYVPPRGSGGMIFEIKPAVKATTTDANLIASSTPAVEPKAKPIIKPQILPQVLGVKIFADGSLIKFGKKVYVIMNGKRTVIKNLRELAKYRGQKINVVDAKTLNQYPEVLSDKTYPDNTIVKIGDKLYIIKKGQKQYVKNLKELQAYIKLYKITKLY